MNTTTKSVPDNLSTCFSAYSSGYASSVPIFNSLLEAISELSNESIHSIDELNLKPVSGGDINKASILTFNDAQSLNSVQPFNASKPGNGAYSVFLKQNSIDNLGILSSEAVSLCAISDSGVRTCRPLALGKDKELDCSFLILPVIHTYKGAKGATPSSTKGWEDLAVQLASLHQTIPPQPNALEAQSLTASDNTQQWYAGWFENNYIGSNPQFNSWTVDWHAFFAEYRLGKQTQMAYDNHYLDKKTVQQIERLQHKIDQYLPNYSIADNNGNPRPSLLHGDLWAGNAMIGGDSYDSHKPLGYLIDPAVYVGHPETDLAMTRLFGGFADAFYDIYLSHCSIESGFTERMDIYNLYHYLNHLNLFGRSYLGAIQRIAQHFGN